MKTRRMLLDVGFQLLAGTVAVHLVFLINLFWMLLQSHSPTGGVVLDHIFQNSAFWVSSVVAFIGTFYLAR
jgi:hypothetical protein